MTTSEEVVGMTQPGERTDERIGEMFPDRGEAPDNTVVVDPNAEPAPNTAHPE